MAEQKVTLKSQDNELVEVSVEVAKMSATLKNVLEDLGEHVDNKDEPIPIIKVTGEILKKVIGWCKYHYDNDTKEEEEEDDFGEEKEKEKITDDKISPWDEKFFEDNYAVIFDLILAANYLEIKQMIGVACQTVANKIKGKSAEEIRAMFNIENDFTPEEEEANRKECAWLED